MIGDYEVCTSDGNTYQYDNCGIITVSNNGTVRFDGDEGFVGIDGTLSSDRPVTITLKSAKPDPDSLKDYIIVESDGDTFRLKGMSGVTVYPTFVVFSRGDEEMVWVKLESILRFAVDEPKEESS